MELTREEIEKLASGDMTYNELRDKYTTISCIPIHKIAQMLLAEMDKPKVWDGAPEWATEAEIRWTTPTRYSDAVKRHTRELKKSRAREIAEEAAKKIRDYDYFHEAVDIKQTVAGIVESAILKDREERKQS